MGVVTDFRDERLSAAELAALAAAALPRRRATKPVVTAGVPAAELPVPNRHDRARGIGGRIGRGIGIAAVYLIAGAIWSWRGAAWGIGRARAWR